MSEKIYAFLLRLYPARFRQTYGDEALQLFRDRSRHERGFFPAIRLWLDLLRDLAVSLPREYCQAQPAIAATTAAHGAPSFLTLKNESPRVGILIFGGALSLAIAAAALLIPSGHFGTYKPLDTAFANVQVAVAAHGTSAGLQSPDQATDPQAVPPASQLDIAERQRVIRAAIRNLKQHYVDSAVAQTIADALLAHEKAGDYTVADDASFAGLVTTHMRDAGHDLHLELIYSQRTLPDVSAAPPPEARERYRAAMEQQNCTFEKVEILPHNLGYLKLNSFPDPSVCQSKAASAMTSLNHADSIIFDLRDNRGGYPDMVMFIAAHLFDHPEYMYNPRENTTDRFWTRSPVPDSKLAEKPVYILTSTNTASAAEHFSYDLKMLKRATLVGETTAGAGHSGVVHRIDDHFAIAITESRPINPFSKADWAVTGVEPDVTVKAADALGLAEKLATHKPPGATGVLQ